MSVRHTGRRRGEQLRGCPPPKRTEAQTVYDFLRQLRGAATWIQDQAIRAEEGPGLDDHPDHWAYLLSWAETVHRESSELFVTLFSSYDDEEELTDEQAMEILDGVGMVRLLGLHLVPTEFGPTLALDPPDFGRGFPREEY